ncbi:hypothetical protein HanPSC8_Chr12g0503051 [Helianthus annuus]|nr:hypothetical protein HanPSC8_Chr12g0503051 [Helianthus annuus]
MFVAACYQCYWKNQLGGLIFVFTIVLCVGGAVGFPLLSDLWSI